MHPLEFLKTCELLVSSPTRAESDNRTILSRLYYAFFLTLLKGLANRDPGFSAKTTKLRDDHRLVRDYLKGARYTLSGQTNWTGNRVAWYERYDALYVWRLNADYDMDYDGTEVARAVEELMGEAEMLKAKVESFVQ